MWFGIFVRFSWYVSISHSESVEYVCVCIFVYVIPTVIRHVVCIIEGRCPDSHAIHYREHLRWYTYAWPLLHKQHEQVPLVMLQTTYMLHPYWGSATACQRRGLAAETGSRSLGGAHELFSRVHITGARRADSDKLNHCVPGTTAGLDGPIRISC